MVKPNFQINYINQLFFCSIQTHIIYFLLFLSEKTVELCIYSLRNNLMSLNNNITHTFNAYKKSSHYHGWIKIDSKTVNSDDRRIM